MPSWRMSPVSPKHSLVANVVCPIKGKLLREAKCLVRGLSGPDCTIHKLKKRSRRMLKNINDEMHVLCKYITRGNFFNI